MCLHEFLLMQTNENLTRKDEEPLSWFAMSATFGRELKAREYLENKSVRCFIPMKYEVVNSRQGKTRKLVPAIHNLLFVYTTKSRIQSLKTGVSYLQYLTQHLEGRNIPIVVPEHQMQQFISVCETHDEKLVYLAPDEINLEKGTPVRVIGGAFDEVEGTFVKIDRSRKKRVVVYLQGIAAVMIADITDGYLKVLE